MSDTIFDLFRAEDPVGRALLSVVKKAPGVTVQEIATLANRLGLVVELTVRPKLATKPDGGA